MSRRRWICGFVLAWGCAVVGCQSAPAPRRLPTGCAGKANAAEAIAALAERAASLRSFQASAQCVLAWDLLTDAPRKEMLDAQARFMPPDNLFLRGDKFGEVRLGANRDEFWLRIKQLDTYWHGRRDAAAGCQADLPLDPSILLDAFGAPALAGDWTLSHRDGWDILTCRQNGLPAKILYVDCCRREIARVEYFDAVGRLKAALELADYQPTPWGATMPTSIRAAMLIGGLEDAAAHIRLRSIRPFEPTDAQRGKLFARPPRDGYGAVLKLGEDCQFHPQED